MKYVLCRLEVICLIKCLAVLAAWFVVHWIYYLTVLKVLMHCSKIYIKVWRQPRRRQDDADLALAPLAHEAIIGALFLGTFSPVQVIT